MIGIANAFSGGIFLSVALLHLLPESTEAFHDYFESTENNEEEKSKNSGEHSHFPISFLLTFCGYTIILLIEKIIFDPHTIEQEQNIEQTSETEMIDYPLKSNQPILNNNDNSLLNHNISSDLEQSIGKEHYHKKTHQKKNSLYFENSNSNANDFPQKISPLCNCDNNVLNPLRSDLKGAKSFINKPMKDYNNLHGISMNLGSNKKEFKDQISIRKKNMDKDEMKFKEAYSNLGQFSKAAKIKFKPKKDVSVRNSRFTVDLKNDYLIPKEDANKDKTITSYLLILALSIHAAFEGIALGLQDKKQDLFYMLLAIAFHKWVEALSIGIHLNKSKIDKETVLKLIVCFSLMTPVGSILGIFLSGISSLLEASFLSISAGSFIYISASEVIIEEFSVSKYKLEKFIAFILGATIICIMTFTEHNH